MMNLEKCKVLSILDSVLHEKGIKKKDENYAYHCPRCHHHKRKLEIDVDSQVYHCWTCDLRGRKIRNLLLFVKADRKLVSEVDKIYGGNYKEREIDEDGEIEIVSLPMEFKSLSVPTNSIEYKQALCYIKNRGITGYDILKYNIGYCEEGRYKNRIVIPSYDENGILNFFSCRSYYDNNFKYFDAESSKNIVGFELFIDWQHDIFICEGALDAVSIKRNAIPLFGKILSPLLKERIIKNNVKNIFLMLDSDKFGIKSFLNISKYLLDNGVNVYKVDLNGKDASEVGFLEVQESIKMNSKKIEFDDFIKLKLN